MPTRVRVALVDPYPNRIARAVKSQLACRVLHIGRELYRAPDRGFACVGCKSVVAVRNRQAHEMCRRLDKVEEVGAVAMDVRDSFGPLTCR